MRIFNTTVLLFTAALYLSICEGKCRKNVVKLKRSLKLAISSDDINNRHKAALRKVFRRRRDVKDDEDIESDKFTAEIKFLQTWNPAMKKKDGSAYRLFQGNVLDSILEQMNADRRFINSKVLDLKQTPGGILAKVGFHFRKSERNPVSHVRFVITRGHLSSLKVDKNYFKILKTPANLFSEPHKGKTSGHPQHSTKEKNSPNLPKPKHATQKVHNEPPSTDVVSQTQVQHENQPPNNDQTQNQPSTGVQNQSQNNTKSQSSASASMEYQAPYGQNQDQTTTGNALSQTQDQNAAQIVAEQQTQATSQTQNQNSAQDNPQVSDNQNPFNQPQVHYQTEAPGQQQTYTPEPNVAAYQPAQQSNVKLTQTTPNPSSNTNTVQTQDNDQSNIGNQKQPNAKPVDNTPSAPASSEKENKKNKEFTSVTKNDEEIVSIKMNQAWFPFLKNHDSPQYKMLAGNLKKGLKSVMGDDKNIKDIQVKDLLQADEGHTKVKFKIKFNGDKETSTKKLRNIVKSGDIAGISVEANYFRVKENEKAGVQK